MLKKDLLSAGEFAKLARTTKRTILWYDKKGVLPPKLLDESGYRYYEESQLIDFQAITLLQQWGLSLQEISDHSGNKRTVLKELFQQRKAEIASQIESLQIMLETTENFYSSLDKNKTLVEGELAYQDSKTVHFMKKVGAYSKVADYFIELRSHFEFIPEDAEFIVAYKEAYSPRRSEMIIGIEYSSELIFKDGENLPILKLPKYRCLTYAHHGISELLVLLWQELDKFRLKKRMCLDRSVPYSGIEVYKDAPLLGEVDAREVILQLPIQ